MLCHACHVHTRRDHPYCLHCGTIRKGAQVDSFAAPELRLGDKTFALSKAITTIGRGADNDLVIDDPSVSREHARIVRTAEGFRVEDLKSFNGTTVGQTVYQGDGTLLADESQLHIGDVPVRFAQPRDIAVGSKTMVRGTEFSIDVSTVEIAPTAQSSLGFRPTRRSSWALKQVEQRWVLRNTRTGRYLELDERDVFIWHQLDSQNTIRDILFGYAVKYGELALPRIERTLSTFAALDLIRGIPGLSAKDTPTSSLRRFGRVVLRTLLRMEVSISGLDHFFTWAYRSFGWLFFTRAAVTMLWLLVGAGLVGMWMADGRNNLFDLGGAGWLGAAVLAVGYLIALAIHEAAHALAVKSYGRKVTRGGFMLMMGVPFAFVDTSDMWFGGRWSRIVVTISGPLSTAALAGACALTAAYAPDPAVAAIAYQLAFGLYLNTLYNLNPVMPLDGYQALADALRMPRLREQASAYFLKGIWSDLRHGHRPGWMQIGLAAYGFAAVVGIGLFIVMAFMMWRDRLGGLADRYLPPGVDTIVIAFGIGIVLFPVWYHLFRTLAGQVVRRRAMRKEAAT